MVKAVYMGVDDNPLQNGRVYKISTFCSGNRLVVSVRNTKRVYHSLEGFLKEWRVKAVYHGKF